MWRRTDWMEKAKMSKEKEYKAKKEKMGSYKVSKVRECKVSKVREKMMEIKESMIRVVVG